MSLSGDYLAVAKIVGFHGLRGQVKVKLFTENMDSFANFADLFADNAGHAMPLTLTHIVAQGQSLVVSFKELEDRTAAEKLGKAYLYTSATSFPDLPDNEYYWKDLIGLQVISEAGSLGIVDHLVETGSNDVLVVKATQNSIDKRERLVPYLDHVITEIDLNKRTILVDWDAEF